MNHVIVQKSHIVVHGHAQFCEYIAYYEIRAEN